MSKLKDLTGQRFGRLVVVERDENTDQGLARWRCKCGCGNYITVRGSHLRSDATKSCGCISSEMTTARNYKHGQSTRKSVSRLYNVWAGMKQRCDDPNHSSYNYYGGRGVSVCTEWQNSYEIFESWALSSGYDEYAARGKCTLDRINVNGNYEPENCRWVDMKTQANNRRNNSYI